MTERLADSRQEALQRSSRRSRVLACNATAIIAAAAVLWFLEANDRSIAAPLLVIVDVVVLYLSVLWGRDGVPPVFESGTLCVLATAVYGAVPLLGFLMMHGRWTPDADNRLFAYPFIPSELGVFGWRYVVYLVSFTATYLVIRRTATVGTTPLLLPPMASVASIGVCFAALECYKLGLKAEYGYDLDVSYADLHLLSDAIGRMPYVVLQISQHLVAAFLVVQLGVMVLLLSLWRFWPCRALLVAWLGLEAATRVLLMGARTPLVLLLLSVGILYHRFVRPLSFGVLALGGATLVTGFLVLGAVRGGQSADLANAVVSSNEFQGLFVTAFDLYKMNESGMLDVPWQVSAAEVLLLIPSQVLPFEKIEPGTWYIDVIGQTGQGIGFMYGVISQSVLGLGWMELVLRGMALGASLALLHRWYVSRAAHFWPTVFYAFVTIWTYYTFRWMTFSILFYILYRFVPVFVGAKAIELALSRVRGPSLLPH